MTTINLLPWREHAREKEKKLFIIGLGVRAVSSLMVVLAIYMVLNARISSQEVRNDIVKQEIARYDRQIREIRQIKIVRQALIVRMSIIQQLQANRPEIVHFFNELAKIMPESIYLTRVIRTGQSIMLIGHADTNSSVSLLMHNIRKNFWVNLPVLEEVQEVSDKKKNKVYNQFRVKLVLRPKNKLKNPVLSL